jgi:hypothetical protein
MSGRLDWGAEHGGDQERARLVAVQAGGLGLMVEPGIAGVHCRRMAEQLLFEGVLLEPGDGA